MDAQIEFELIDGESAMDENGFEIPPDSFLKECAEYRANTFWDNGFTRLTAIMIRSQSFFIVFRFFPSDPFLDTFGRGRFLASLFARYLLHPATVVFGGPTRSPTY